MPSKEMYGNSIQRNTFLFNFRACRLATFISDIFVFMVDIVDGTCTAAIKLVAYGISKTRGPSF